MRVQARDYDDNLLGEWDPQLVTPPRTVFYDGHHYVHCGTISPENVAIYRRKPFGTGKNIAQTKNGNYTGYSGGNLFSGERK